MIMFVILAIFAFILFILFILMYMDDDGIFDGIKYGDIYEPRYVDRKVSM